MTRIAVAAAIFSLSFLLQGAEAAPYFGREHTIIMNRAARANAAHNATIRHVQQNIARQRRRM